ncbi:MAG: class I SAM-dependent methyltransferase [Pedobacter sp.]
MRILEPEIMMGEEEVKAYDLLTRQYLEILHAGFVETVLNLCPSGGRFLDVGTGTGWIAIGVAKHDQVCHVVGIDLSDSMLSVAVKNSVGEGVGSRVTFQRGNASQIPFDDNTFDAVFCHNMLHHIPEPISLIREMKRVVKKDGAFAARDLVRHSPFVTFLHVNLFGFRYNELMKKEYRDSILAALSSSEWRDLFIEANIEGAKITKQFATHQGIERPAKNRRANYITVPTSSIARIGKAFYTSKP